MLKGIWEDLGRAAILLSGRFRMENFISIIHRPAKEKLLIQESISPMFLSGKTLRNFSILQHLILIRN
jgi:hypothetical protein